MLEFFSSNITLRFPIQIKSNSLLLLKSVLLDFCLGISSAFYYPKRHLSIKNCINVLYIFVYMMLLSLCIIEIGNFFTLFIE